MSKIDVKQLKADFIKLLQSTNREGVAETLAWLEASDFFTAPASTAFHGNYEGGLLEHSMNCAHVGVKLREMMMTIKPEVGTKVSRDNVLIATLLHDVCKANVYRHTVKNKKIDGVWQEIEGYAVDYSEFPLGHGEKSVIILLRLGLKLTDEEIMAIRWHMNAWDLPFQSPELKANISMAREKTPLCTIMQCADGLASGVLEDITEI